MPVSYQVPCEPKVSIVSKVGMNDAYPSGVGDALLQCVDFVRCWYRNGEDGKGEGEEGKKNEGEFVHRQAQVA